MSTLNISGSPHIRSYLSTGDIMYDVILALTPAAFFGIWHFGVSAAVVLIAAIVSAVLTEWVFCKVTKRPCTLGDKSAIMTGLMLGLCLSPSVPLYIPILGSIFAILFVKCCFGGLGQNFMNPALAGRCFLLISFGTAMTNYAVDGMTSATPLAQLADGASVSLWEVFLGFTTGTIGVSCAAILLGGLYLLICGDITWHIPTSFIGAFVLTIAAIGGKGFDLDFLLVHVCGGGLLLGAFFMATDPVTSPMLPSGQLLFGCLLGILTAVFRIYGSSADSISYAIIIGNMLVPLIDRMPVPRPFGIGDDGMAPKQGFPKAAVVLMVITLLAGIALGGVSFLTKDAIEAQNQAAAAEAYRSVLPDADGFTHDKDVDAYIAEHAGEVYGTAYGKVYINEMVFGGSAGYAVSVTSAEGFDGTITLSVGISADGTVTGIAFTELHETAGMGMRADEAEWKAQFAGVNTEAFNLVKGGASADNDIDSITGATRTSTAVVNAVNAALDFVRNHVK